MRKAAPPGRADGQANSVQAGAAVARPRLDAFYLLWSWHVCGDGPLLLLS